MGLPGQSRAEHQPREEQEFVGVQTRLLAAGTEDLPMHEPTGDGGAAAFLHGPDQLFGNVVALPTAISGDETATATATTSTAEGEAS